jgi:hypothetical protein|tara:strand:- start:157 stop:840 length:684 start_codon:yes stop_codon:yes gene_type:complete
MKKLTFLLALAFITNSAFSQYCTFYEFEAKDPEMVVSTLNKMMSTEWAKNLEGSKSLYQYEFNGANTDTHVMQFCFPDEASIQKFMMSFGSSPIAQLLGEKLDTHINKGSSWLGTPAWFQNDWSKDQVFMMWEMEVSNSEAYANAFIPFAKNMMVKMNNSNSMGLGYPILGKDSFSHFVWAGAPDVETALKRTKQMYEDPEFTKFNKEVAGIRKIVNTKLMIKVMDF